MSRYPATRFLRLAATAAATVFISACQSARDTRAQEKADVLRMQSPEVQAKVRTGLIETGFTTELVYIALGRPDRTSTGKGDSGPTTAWYYRNFPVSGTNAAATGMNVPGARTQNGGLASANAPGGSGSISRTGPSGVQAGIGNVPDVAVATLVVEFSDERVTAIRFDP
jgi:hypothetical protein